MKILELFSGYGTACHALKQLQIPHEIVGYSDIDKYANQCFQQNHGGKELGDVRKIDPNDLEDFNLLTGGFPCQTFSIAGKHMGELDTRGTLFNEIIRIAAAKKPRYMLLENVKGLLSKKHRKTFIKIAEELHRIGYYVKIKVLNTKEYGIPQNRDRVWFACFREIEDWSSFEFPEKEELKIFLKDILEENVDEKYYLSEEKTKELLFDIDLSKENRSRDEIMTLNKPSHSNERVYSDEGCSPTLNTMQGGHRQPFILVKNATKKGYLVGYPNDGVNLEHPHSKTRRGRIQKDVMGCLQTNDQRGVITGDLRIRKLTPTECFRLQGFLDDDINLAGISNSQKYKLCGNGQSVNIVRKIFENMRLKDFEVIENGI